MQRDPLSISNPVSRRYIELNVPFLKIPWIVHKRHRGQMLSSPCMIKMHLIDRIIVIMSHRGDSDDIQWMEWVYKILAHWFSRRRWGRWLVLCDWKRLDDFKTNRLLCKQLYWYCNETFPGDYDKANYDLSHEVSGSQNFVTEKTWRCFHWRRPVLLNAEPKLYCIFAWLRLWNIWKLPDKGGSPNKWR